MAQRRMFSDKIVDTDSFLDMGQGAQLLYFHLCMRADDDGFVSNPKKIMRMIGAQDDDFKVLLAKRFVIQFESGVCVIKHWLIHNLIRNDRYNETQWVKEKKLLVVDEETRKYSLIKPLATECQPNGNQLAPQVRLGKVRLEESKNKNFSPTFKPNTEKGWRDLRRVEAGKEPSKTPRSEKQVETFEALKWKDYFRDQGHAQHGMQFFRVKNEKREKIVSKLVITASKEVDMKGLIDWWFAGAGEWAEYEPEQCFSSKTIEKFLNKGKVVPKNKQSNVGRGVW